MIIDVFVQSYLFFEQVVETNYKVVSADSFLNLDDDVKINVAVTSVHHRMILQHNALVAKTIAVAAESNLALSQVTHPKVRNVEAHSYLTLIQEAKHEDQWPLVEQHLDLVQVVECIVAHGTYDILALAHTATFNMTRNVSASSSLDMDGKARAYKPDKMFINDPTLTVEAP